MVSIERILRIVLPARQSAFLWGPRKTGKSTYLRSAFPGSLTFDLLQTDLMLELTKRPALLRERLLAAPPEELRSPVILDEVQKVPQLLDEVHWLIENQGLSFILCVSSGGNAAAAKIPLTPDYQVPFAAKVKSATGLVTRAVGLIAAPEQAEAILAEGKADFIAMARA